MQIYARVYLKKVFDVSIQKALHFIQGVLTISFKGWEIKFTE